jgi:arabinosaccharide transport system permease protein
MKQKEIVHGKKEPSKRKNLLYSQKIAPYFFVGPFIITFLLFFLYPVLSSIIMSFQEVLPGKNSFIGLKNFKNLFNGDFKQAVFNSIVYTVITCAVLVPLPILFAVFLNSKKVAAKGFFRSVFFLPALVSVVVGGFTFRLIFGEMDTALLNSILGLFELEPVKWLGGPMKWTTFLALLVLCCWRWMGVNNMYYTSGLQSIPGELYESASIDGANSWQSFLHVTVPFLKPTATYVLTISIYGGMSMFLESRMLFNGGRYPGGQGLTIVGYLYRLGWDQNKIGLGCAVGLCLLALTLVVNLVQLKFTGFFKKE